MNDAHYPQLLRIKYLTLALLIAGLVTAVLAITLTQTVQAGFSCAGNNWFVATEPELNDAITCYNGKITEDNYTISFTQNISLTASTNTISNTVTGTALIIEGTGFTIDGQGIAGVRPFDIANNTYVTIQNTTIANGKTASAGILEDLRGGGIRNNGNLILTNSTVSNNAAEYGGGIYNAGSLTISNSTLSGNSVNENGGGLSNDGSATISDSTMSNNTANNHGGGLTNNGTINITSSTFNNNMAERNGGGIHTWKTLAISNSTISGNAASEFGGGLFNEETAAITNSTIFNNRTVPANGGGGIASFDDPFITVTTTISNSIVSGNIVSGTANATDVAIFIKDSADTFVSNGYNLIGHVGANIDAFNQVGDQTGVLDPKLEPLQDNGNSTLTHALLADSPAINAGNSHLAVDQRGVARPQAGVDDIGAYEYQFPYNLYLPIILQQ